MFSSIPPTGDSVSPLENRPVQPDNSSQRVEGMRQPVRTQVTIQVDNNLLRVAVNPAPGWEIIPTLTIIPQEDLSQHYLAKGSRGDFPRDKEWPTFTGEGE